MKAFVLTFLLSGVALGASAQMADRLAPGPKASALTTSVDQLTRQMARQLQLNEAQYIRLKAINQTKLARTDDLHWQYQQDPAALQQKLLELQAQYDQEFRRLLSPTQLSQLLDEQRRQAQPAPDPAGNGLG